MRNWENTWLDGRRTSDLAPALTVGFCPVLLQVLVFYFLRCVLAFSCCVCELYFYKWVHRRLFRSVWGSLGGVRLGFRRRSSFIITVMRKQCCCQSCDCVFVAEPCVRSSACMSAASCSPSWSWAQGCSVLLQVHKSLNTHSRHSQDWGMDTKQFQRSGISASIILKGDKWKSSGVLVMLYLAAAHNSTFVPSLFKLSTQYDEDNSVRQAENSILASKMWFKAK